MSGPIAVSPHPFPKKRFQAATVSAIDRQAEAIQALYTTQQAQGHVLADLAVDRDALKQADQAEALLRQAIGQAFVTFQTRSFFGRLTWLLTGR